MNSEYSERFVLFLDLLGFKTLIQRARKEKRLFNKIKKALHQVSRSEIFFDDNLFSELELAEKMHGKEITNFSDSLTISFPISYSPLKDNHDSLGIADQTLVFILRDIFSLYVYLSPLGFPLRGGVTKGLVYHKRDVIFGEALIEAYYLESEIAKVPRIIFSESFLQHFTNQRSDLIERFKGEEITSILKQDEDGIYFFNHLSFSDLMSSLPILNISTRKYKRSHNHKNYIQLIRGLIQSMLMAPSNEESILLKAEWSKKYFNEFLKRCKDHNHLIIQGDNEVPQ